MKVKKYYCEDALRICSFVILIVGSTVIGWATNHCHPGIGWYTGVVIFFGFSLPFHIWDEKSKKYLELYVFILTIIKKTIRGKNE